MHNDGNAMSDDALLAIPVFNEERYVRRVICKAKAFCRHILVIDDGSTDRTVELIRRDETLEVIRHPENRGYGKSIADAFAFALGHGYRWIITMDCDEQHEPACIPGFLRAIRRGEADIISGTRYPQGFDVDDGAPADRREINRRITAMLNERLGLGITDAFCGFKGYSVPTLANLNLTVPGYAMPMQFWVQVALSNLRVRELPVPLIYHDPHRHFGGLLDDPDVRLRHYLDVFDAELGQGRAFAGKARSIPKSCLSFT